MISARSYFRGTLVLPLVVPLLSMLVGVLTGWPVSSLQAALMWSLMIGGPPYVLLAIWLWWRLGWRGRWRRCGDWSGRRRWGSCR